MTKPRVLTNITLAALLLATAPQPLLAGGGADSIDPWNPGTLTCATCVYIDLFDGANATNAPPGSPWILPNINGGKGVSVGTLSSGHTYLITVTGTVSYWFKSLWDTSPIVGTPVAPPVYYSDTPPGPSHALQTDTGYDWECVFAYPNFLGIVHPVPSHFPQNRVSLDGGTTYFDPTPLGGQSCAPDHTYRYLVTGGGKQAYFRITDTGPTYDNYGKFKICVQAVCSNADCDHLVPVEDASTSSALPQSPFDPRLLSNSSDK
ncbi:MAG: hypothetical protein ACHQPI_10830 [Thermoanaerobaculia bacterium]